MSADWVSNYSSYGQLIDDPVSRCPDREAIIYNGRRFTYAQLDGLINKTANYLLGSGVHKGSMVAIISRNCAEYIIAELALYRIGAVAVKINWRLTPCEMAYMLDLNEVTHAFYRPENDPWGEELTAMYRDRIQFIFMDAWESEKSLVELVGDCSDAPVDVNVSREDVACHLHTSGTTGHPKCVVYTHGAMLNELQAASEAYPYPDGQKYQFIAQMFHAAAIGAHLSLVTGGTMVLMQNFQIDTYMQSLVNEKVNAISVVPTILKWILDEMDRNHYDLSSLNTVNYSTCPIPPVLLCRAMDKLHCSFYQSYGMTEMGSIVTVLGAQDHVTDDGKHLNSVGRPIRNAAVKIVGDDGNECPQGRSGEIYVKGPGMMKEYFKQPELTAAAMSDGWYKTKDVGFIDEFGYLNLCGRADDLIISGGENIYPGEVLNVIMRLCGDVAEAAVYGVPDEIWGEHVKASVVLMPESKLTPQELKDYCRKNMPSFRVPKEIEFLKELPKSATGKVLVSELKKNRK